MSFHYVAWIVQVVLAKRRSKLPPVNTGSARMISCFNSTTVWALQIYNLGLFLPRPLLGHENASYLFLSSHQAGGPPDA